jgi:hypothetical protein
MFVPVKKLAHFAFVRIILSNPHIIFLDYRNKIKITFVCKMYTYNFIPGQTAVIISGRNRGCYVKILLQNEGRYFRNPQYIVQLLHKDPPSAVKVLQSMLHVPRVAENTGVVSFSASVLRVAHAFVPVLEERHRSGVIISSCIQVEWTFKQQHYLYLI